MAPARLLINQSLCYHLDMKLLTPSNLLSLLRLPLAALLFVKNPWVRCASIVTALLSDGLDGFIARRTQAVSQLGAWLDPITDKIFVLVALLLFSTEGNLGLVDMFALLSRDAAVLLFGLYLVLSGRLSRMRLQAIWCGKITTVLQFSVLIALCWGATVPAYVFQLFIVLGVLALAELCLLHGAFTRTSATPQAS